MCACFILLYDPALCALLSMSYTEPELSLIKKHIHIVLFNRAWYWNLILRLFFKYICICKVTLPYSENQIVVYEFLIWLTHREGVECHSDSSITTRSLKVHRCKALANKLEGEERRGGNCMQCVHFLWNYICTQTLSMSWGFISVIKSTLSFNFIFVHFKNLDPSVCFA